MFNVSAVIIFKWNRGHLTFGKKKRDIWEALLVGFICNWNRTATINEWIEGRETKGSTPVGKVIWRALAHAVVWGIWTERNKRIFEDERLSDQQLLNYIKSLLWDFTNSNSRLRGIRIEQLKFSWGKTITSC